MSDKELEDYLAGKTGLPDAYGSLPDVSPPGHLDAAILAEAHRAVNAGPDTARARKPRWRSWAVPLSAVATLFVVVMVGMETPYTTHEMHPQTLPVPVSPPAADKSQAAVPPTDLRDNMASDKNAGAPDLALQQKRESDAILKQGSAGVVQSQQRAEQKQMAAPAPAETAPMTAETMAQPSAQAKTGHAPEMRANQNAPQAALAEADIAAPPPQYKKRAKARRSAEMPPVPGQAYNNSQRALGATNQVVLAAPPASAPAAAMPPTGSEAVAQAEVPSATSEAGQAAPAVSGEGGFSFEGFYLGMPKAEASRLHPEAHWLRDFPEGPQGYNKLSAYYKQFRSSYFGEPVNVRISLDEGGRAVDTVLIMFSASPNKQCGSGADAARKHLTKTYGAGVESLDHVGNTRVVWHAAEGYTVVWYSSCRQADWYTVTYTRRGD